MEKIDIECTYADVLESSSDTCLLGEEVLVVTEVHHHDKHEGVHRHSFRQVCPLVLDAVPPEDVCAAEKGEQDADEEKALSVEKPLDAWPVAVGDVAEQEEVHELQGLIERTVHHEIGLPPFAECLG